MKYYTPLKGKLICVFLNIISILYLVVIFMYMFMSIISAFGTVLSNFSDVSDTTETLYLEEVEYENHFDEEAYNEVVDTLIEMEYTDSSIINSTDLTALDELVYANMYEDIPLYYTENYMPIFIENIIMESYPNAVVDTTALIDYYPLNIWRLYPVDDYTVELQELYDYTLDESGSVVSTDFRTMLTGTYSVEDSTFIFELK